MVSSKRHYRASQQKTHKGRKKIDNIDNGDWLHTKYIHDNKNILAYQDRINISILLRSVGIKKTQRGYLIQQEKCEVRNNIQKQ
ncbi:XRE family transcriptional regulator [Sesbania bispinosa]|nr:XRE family transcriptional regulator [Sesbania bispinosa]